MDANLLRAAGLAQVAIFAAGLAIPRVLGWREQAARLGPLTRQVFWTYAGYISASNLTFGLLDLLGTAHLLDGSTLARAVSGFIAAWWGARLVLQFAYYDRSGAPPGRWPKFAEVFFVLLFAYAAALHGWIACR